jgi:hypothetical protein
VSQLQRISAACKMSSAASRAFSTSGKNAIKRLGATVADIKAQNPDKDVTKVLAAIDKIEADAEKRVRTTTLSRKESPLTVKL